MQLCGILFKLKESKPVRDTFKFFKRKRYEWTLILRDREPPSAKWPLEQFLENALSPMISCGDRNRQVSATIDSQVDFRPPFLSLFSRPLPFRYFLIASKTYE